MQNRNQRRLTRTRRKSMYIQLKNALLRAQDGTIYSFLIDPDPEVPTPQEQTFYFLCLQKRMAVAGFLITKSRLRRDSIERQAYAEVSAHYPIPEDGMKLSAATKATPYGPAQQLEVSEEARAVLAARDQAYDRRLEELMAEPDEIDTGLRILASKNGFGVELIGCLDLPNIEIDHIGEVIDYIRFNAVTLQPGVGVDFKSGRVEPALAPSNQIEQEPELKADVDGAAAA